MGVMPRPLLINMPWRSGGNTPTPALPHRGGGRWSPGREAAAEAAAHVGNAYALAGLLRAVPYHASAGRCYIPADVATEAGLDPRDYTGLRATPGVRRAVSRIAEIAGLHLTSARQLHAGVPRAALPALLPAVIADRALARLRRAGWNPFDARLAASDTLQSWRLAAAVLRRRF